MKALLFLTFRSFLNGVKRALGSPTRLIGLLFFFGYYFVFFVRPGMRGESIGGTPVPVPAGAELPVPPLEILHAAVFGVFAVLSMFLMLGTSVQQNTFKPADVDILFPTPISPKLILGFRMIRDYLLTLIVPFFLLLFGLGPARAGWQGLTQGLDNPDTGPMVLRAMVMAWLLMAMGWTTVNYAVSLYVNRSDTDADRNRRILGWSLSLLVLGIWAYGAWQIQRNPSLETAVALTESPALRTLFFTATFASQMTMAPLEQSWLAGLLSLAGLLGMVAVGVALSVRQVGWMYDQAAVRGFGTSAVREATRKGDTLAAVAEYAKTGKYKARTVPFLRKWRRGGAWALIWKDLILQIRGMLAVLVLMVLMGLGFALLPALIARGEGSRALGGLVIFFNSMAVFMCTMTLANVSYLEVLRRIDLQKPLPFSPSRTVFFEVVSKSLLGMVSAILGAILVMVLAPSLAPFAIAAILFSPGLSVLLSATVFLTIILFPDMDDQTQRSFRGLVMMLAMAVFGLPPVGAFVGVTLIGWPPFVAGLLAGLLCLGIAAAVTAGAGSLYADYNPSE